MVGHRREIETQDVTCIGISGSGRPVSIGKAAVPVNASEARPPASGIAAPNGIAERFEAACGVSNPDPYWAVSDWRDLAPTNRSGPDDFHLEGLRVERRFAGIPKRIRAVDEETETPLGIGH